MKRFILISFGFLGWAFYEMSGGSDFDPSDIREARLAALEEKEPAAKPEPAAQQTATVAIDNAPKIVVDTDPPRRETESEVTRVSLNLTSLQSVLEPETEETAEAAPESQPAEDAVPQNVSIITSSADTPAIIPSLIAPGDGLTIAAAEPAAEELGDLRTVSGSRVNVRGGPGTNYGVVASLVEGDEVVVLESNGNGWVRFESVDGTTSGWLAEFLLADS